MKKLFTTFALLSTLVIIKAQPVLYGLTSGDLGTLNYGTISKYEEATNTLSATFKFSDNGRDPRGSLLKASDGKLYGMTNTGGSSDQGVIFSFDPATSAYTKVKDFDGINGAFPNGSLLQATNGKLYGTTSRGGVSGVGVIFSFDPATSAYIKLKDFDGTNGRYPTHSLLQASDGKLYGMTSRGGSSDYGVIFSFDPATSAYTKVKDFDYTNGANPAGSLLQASDGKLYGMTNQGGSGSNNDLFSGFGVIFSFDPVTSAYTTVMKFGDVFTGLNGRNPYGSLLQASDGKLYGMTTFGGSNGYNDDTGLGLGYGVIFSLDPATSAYTKVKDFDGADGRNPYGSLFQASNGKLYGMTHEGGSSDYGVVFSYEPSSSTYTKLKDFDGSNGARPYEGSAFIEVNESITLSCPSSVIGSTDKGRCDAIVNNIDPVLQGSTTQINYILSGATIESGSGTVSGKKFNKGVTSVTYSLANNASINCSFTVTVNDEEPPSITNVAADPASLWPPNHKMREVTISYDITDNCGFNSPNLSVSSNATNANSTDWIVADNHHLQLRAEQGARGTERIYTITISVTDLSGNKSIKTIEVSVSKNKTKAKSNTANRSAIIEEENVQNLIIKATPNPSLNYFTLFTKSNSDKPINVRVTDVLGRVVEKRVNISANGKLQLGSNYRQGIYFVEVVQGTQWQLVKLVKQ